MYMSILIIFIVFSLGGLYILCLYILLKYSTVQMFSSLILLIHFLFKVLRLRLTCDQTATLSSDPSSVPEIATRILMCLSVQYSNCLYKSIEKDRAYSPFELLQNSVLITFQIQRLYKMSQWEYGLYKAVIDDT